jgi:hypothetical protein
MPISILTVMFLLSLYYSKKEKHTQTLTSATPVSQSFYLLIRSAAVAVCFLIICTVIIALSFYFYIVSFDYRNFAAFAVPALLILPPCFIFALGLGHLAGGVHLSLLYILMLVSLAFVFVGNGGSFDFFGAGYFNSYPLTLPAGADGEPSFALSAGFQTARVIYFLLGVVLLALVHCSFLKGRLSKGISFSAKVRQLGLS